MGQRSGGTRQPCDRDVELHFRWSFQHCVRRPSFCLRRFVEPQRWHCHLDFGRTVRSGLWPVRDGLRALRHQRLSLSAFDLLVHIAVGPQKVKQIVQLNEAIVVEIRAHGVSTRSILHGCVNIVIERSHIHAACKPTISLALSGGTVVVHCLRIHAAFIRAIRRDGHKVVEFTQ